ncbi:7-cyano-7-deazaguanine synthase QueC [Candidatus Omnitrophota bacterium]
MALKKGIVLLSGGLDSAVTLYYARQQGLDCQCLIFDYGQRHKKEISSAKKIAKSAGCPYKILNIQFPWKGSSLLDKSIRIPQAKRQAGRRSGNKIPGTYVPGRNIIFLSFALSFSEVAGASAIFIGAHTQDYSGYPDCRREFFQAFDRVIKSGTRSGTSRKGIRIFTPLIGKKKSEIIKLGMSLGVPFQLTWSCYKGGSRPCASCESCHFRALGFAEAGFLDPLMER